FDILFEKDIDGDQRKEAGKNLRGGNWNRGPWPVSGGLPAYLFAVNDCFPIIPEKKLAEKHPGLVNSRLLDTKIRIRNAVNSLKTHHQRSNVIHSADNPHQGLEYFHTAVPDCPEFPKIEKKLKKNQNSMKSPFPVIKTLSGHGRRAKVELIHYKDGKAVLKTYRPGRERFLERELIARKLGKDLPEMTPVLEHGENYLVLPFYNDIMDRSKPLSFGVIRRTKNIISHFHSLGFELIDFKPKNIILDSKDGMKIIDFEFLQEGGVSTESLADNFCWYTVEKDFNGDVPMGRKLRRNNYYRYWFASTGVPLFFAVRKIPDILLFPIRLSGQTALYFYHLTGKIKHMFRTIKIILKKSIISVLGKIIG
ncbi:MAG: hypothetical protein KAH95_14055, partial [Spirochaetales bacterium]|nr:hypothetical protein [Spirochaetales bacterium]